MEHHDTRVWPMVGAVLGSVLAMVGAGFVALVG